MFRTPETANAATKRVRNGTRIDGNGNVSRWRTSVRTDFASPAWFLGQSDLFARPTRLSCSERTVERCSQRRRVHRNDGVGTLLRNRVTVARVVGTANGTPFDRRLIEFRQLRHCRGCTYFGDSIGFGDIFGPTAFSGAHDTCATTTRYIPRRTRSTRLPRPDVAARRVPPRVLSRNHPNGRPWHAHAVYTERVCGTPQSPLLRLDFRSLGFERVIRISAARTHSQSISFRYFILLAHRPRET